MSGPNERDRDQASVTVTVDGESSAVARDRSDPAQLVLLFQCDRLDLPSSRHLLDGIREVKIGRGERVDVARDGGTLSIGLPDARMSRDHARLVRQGDGWLVEDRGSKN